MKEFEVPIPQLWEGLMQKALLLVDEIAAHGREAPFWTFGGGTVLMLKYGHRFSKDVDIFVPDPQSLGFVTPRLSDLAESLTTDYTEAANSVKLFFVEGEIDFVAAPNLTSPGFEVQTILGREVNVETSVEIIAKKMWHRGDRITGRDIFDFSLIAEMEPHALLLHADVMVRHADSVLEQLDKRHDSLKKQFEAIDALNYHPTYDLACRRLRQTLEEMRSADSSRPV
ncbi:nucleotidyl transferase AbiEii/AbiGii toxin family protein [Massilia sp. R2A-15]|uniref:nucleotidyl transferase AbiEii/AbiGii toxin family protein n=1 Tax=Massilia sp. R2A-15 TaxID=3064278 RepID=UPI002733A033|nr:nucleotidyl transferase AbiEii/AbiGii toxin family protein [Massilia sp. R2A-15]WLI90744.1 nucleotidyl transferase AbiEii/AbiGii toxin family protein [Massilia sp. R2A-15]